MKTCKHCRYYHSDQCLEKKQNRREPGPDDWCYGWREMTLAQLERLENARLERLEVLRERCRE